MRLPLRTIMLKRVRTQQHYRACRGAKNRRQVWIHSVITEDRRDKRNSIYLEARWPHGQCARLRYRTAWVRALAGLPPDWPERKHLHRHWWICTSTIETRLGATFKGNRYKTDQSRCNKEDLLLDFERDGLKWQVSAEWNIMRWVMRAATAKQQK